MALCIARSAASMKRVGKGRAVPWAVPRCVSWGGTVVPAGSRGEVQSGADLLMCKGLACQVATGFYTCTSREPSAGNGTYIHGPGPLPGAGSSPWLLLWHLQYAALAYWLLHHMGVGEAAQGQLPSEQERAAADAANGGQGHLPALKHGLSAWVECG